MKREKSKTEFHLTVLPVIWLMLVYGPGGCVSEGASGHDPDSENSDPEQEPQAEILPVDPGTEPWVRLPADRVEEECLLDPVALAAADEQLDQPWAIIRFGRLCHEYRSKDMLPVEAFSTTKTFGALVSGAVAYQTRNYDRVGRRTGPLSDNDRVDHWIDITPYNPDAQIAHVLAMVAHNLDLSFGAKFFMYDTVGSVQLNSMSFILTSALSQDPENLGSSLEDFTRRYVYAPLGMRNSTWSLDAGHKIFAFSWATTVRDMARVGLLMLRKGVWNGEQIIDEEWIYRMTHPAFEDANTGMGYSTWLNASTNHTVSGVVKQSAPSMPGSCAPVSTHSSYPNPISESSDCNYAPDYACDQDLDVGVWQAVGAGGQVIQGHPGLDIVLVVRDLDPNGGGSLAPALLWDAVRPAVVNADPSFAGDEQAFCEAYGNNRYGPFQDGLRPGNSALGD